MLTDLPLNVQQMIYNKLPAADRARFCIAVPREVRNQLKRKYTSDERKLNGLSRAIEKRKVRRLSLKMRDFLRTCNADDPTCEPIVAAFPDVKEIMIPVTDPFAKKPNVTKSVLSKMLDGSIVAADLKDFTTEFIQETSEFELSEVLSKLSVSVFEFMWENSLVFHEYMVFKFTNNNWSFILNCIIWSNVVLAEHILANSEKYRVNREGLNVNICEWTTRDTIAWNYQPEFLLRHFPYSREALESIWERLMDDMSVDSASVVDKRLTALAAMDA